MQITYIHNVLVSLWLDTILVQPILILIINDRLKFKLRRFVNVYYVWLLT